MGAALSDMLFMFVSYGESSTSNEWWPKFLEVARRLAARFETTYSHLELSIPRAGPMPQTKTYRYSDRAVARLSGLYSEHGALGASAIVAGPDGNMNVGAMVDLGFSAPTALHSQYRWLLTIDPSIVFADRDKRPEEVVLWILHEFESMLPQEYALAHMMPRERGPGFYFGELYTPRLTDEERASLDRWIRLQPLYREKIRDIYWGNLLSERHGGVRREELFRTVEEEVGKGNVLRLDRLRILFFLPFDIRDEASYEPNLAMWRHRFSDALSEYDVLM